MVRADEVPYLLFDGNYREYLRRLEMQDPVLHPTFAGTAERFRGGSFCLKRR
jgi:hypothetical protein